MNFRIFLGKATAAIFGAIFLSGFVFVASVMGAAAEPRLIGIPSEVSENRGRLAVEIEGTPFIAAFAFDTFGSAGRNSLLIIDPVNGTTEQYWFPKKESSNGQLFHMLRASNGKLYATIGKAFVEFDLRERRWSFEEGIDGMAMSFVEAPTGRIYFGTYPLSTLWEFDPEARRLREVGRLDPVEKYPSFLAAARHGWIYAGIGTGRNNLVALNPETGERRQLAKESERKIGQGQVEPGDDGHVYGRVHNSRGTPWMRLENGRMGPVKDRAVRFAPRSNAHFTQMVTLFPSGGRILACDLPTRTAKIMDKQGKTHEVRIDYESNGPSMSSLTLGEDGRLYGSTNHPMRFWQYDIEQDRFVDYGGIPAVGGGNFPNLAAKTEAIIGATYPDGIAYFFDTEKPWKLHATEGTNPRVLGKYEAIKRPRVTLLLQDKKTVVMSGFPGYGHTGGGMVFFDLERDESTVLNAEELLPGHSTIALRQLENGLLVGGTSTQAPGGGRRTAEKSVIYLMNPDSKKILEKCEIGPDINSLEILGNGKILRADGRFATFSLRSCRGEGYCAAGCPIVGKSTQRGTIAHSR